MKDWEFYHNCISIMEQFVLCRMRSRAKEHNSTKAKGAKIETFAQVQTNVSPRDERHHRLIGLTADSSKSLCAGREFSVVLWHVTCLNERLGQANTGPWRKKRERFLTIAVVALAVPCSRRANRVEAIVANDRSPSAKSFANAHATPRVATCVNEPRSLSRRGSTYSVLLPRCF